MHGVAEFKYRSGDNSKGLSRRQRFVLLSLVKEDVSVGDSDAKRKKQNMRGSLVVLESRQEAVGGQMVSGQRPVVASEKGRYL